MRTTITTRLARSFGRNLRPAGHPLRPNLRRARVAGYLLGVVGGAHEVAPGHRAGLTIARTVR